jgi:hypothetical protein
MNYEDTPFDDMSEKLADEEKMEILKQSLYELAQVAEKKFLEAVRDNLDNLVEAGMPDGMTQKYFADGQILILSTRVVRVEEDANVKETVIMVAHTIPESDRFHNTFFLEQYTVTTTDQGTFYAVTPGLVRFDDNHQLVPEQTSQTLTKDEVSRKGKEEVKRVMEAVDTIPGLAERVIHKPIYERAYELIQSIGQLTDRNKLTFGTFYNKED